ncbi:MAG: hypothetical protein M3541_05395 [Acidobacteriota bacterium]|nr:hypothetical protein [Acidobacteriota bacterium]
MAFGRAAIRTGTSFVGIIYLRPGHVFAAFVLAVIDALREATVEVQPPFIVVAERQQSAVRVAREQRRRGSTRTRPKACSFIAARTVTQL